MAIHNIPVEYITIEREAPVATPIKQLQKLRQHPAVLKFDYEVDNELVSFESIGREFKDYGLVRRMERFTIGLNQPATDKIKAQINNILKQRKPYYVENSPVLEIS